MYRDGDTPIDNQSRESQLAALALDYQGERVRVVADLGYQYQNIQGGRSWFSVAPGVDIPDAPDNETNPFDPAEYSEPRVYYGTLRGEFDLTDQWTAFAGIGGNERRQKNLFRSRRIINEQGNLVEGTYWSFSEAIKHTVWTVESGLRGSFTTGPIRHEPVLTCTRFRGDERDTPFRMPTLSFPASNIYDPVYGPPPDLSQQSGFGDLVKTRETTLSSFALADSLSIWDGRLQFTLGGRLQDIEVTEFQENGDVDEEYGENKLTPMVAWVVKPWQHVSLYGNYVEGLQQGSVAPEGTANAGEVFEPFVTKQYELGVKIDFGRLLTTFSAFQITQPSAFIDPVTNVFTEDGEQRHRGLEFNVFGELRDDVRILGGATYIDAELVETAGGVNEENDANSVPKFQAVLGTEWDMTFLHGLTLTGRVIYTGSAWLDAPNTQKVPDWVRLDLGARYTFRLASGKSVILRANVENALDADYWSEDLGALLIGDPLTFKLSTTFNF